MRTDFEAPRLRMTLGRGEWTCLLLVLSRWRSAELYGSFLAAALAGPREDRGRTSSSPGGNVFELAPGILYEPDPATGSARWVAERLTADTIQGGAERAGAFHRDPHLAGGACDADYEGSGYDKGHLAAAGELGAAAGERCDL